jgi:hypothetical protein
VVISPVGTVTFWNATDAMKPIIYIRR